MSGHNKWSKIKNKKGAEDAKKGKMFTKLARMILLLQGKEELILNIMLS